MKEITGGNRTGDEILSASHWLYETQPYGITTKPHILWDYETYAVKLALPALLLIKLIARLYHLDNLIHTDEDIYPTANSSDH